MIFCCKGNSRDAADWNGLSGCFRAIGRNGKTCRMYCANRLTWCETKCSAARQLCVRQPKGAASDVHQGSVGVLEDQVFKRLSECGLYRWPIY
jgi:hypothetical protein